MMEMKISVIRTSQQFGDVESGIDDSFSKRAFLLLYTCKDLPLLWA